MCGIAGYYNPEKVHEDLQRLYTATALIAHRGPDDEGYAAFNLRTARQMHYVGPDSPDILKTQFPSILERPQFSHHLAFGFRRFSIVDLSEKGCQPFWSRDKSICLIFNGEVYNYVEIRAELKQMGYSFFTTCDTEVLLAGYQAWGIDVLKRCNGPLALVLYDSRIKKLFLARDRLGKSPLYYAIHQGTLYWASEIKAILSMTGRSDFPISEQAVYDYLNFGWRDVENTTFWEGIRTLDAASWTSLDLNEPPTHGRLMASLRRYWEFPKHRLSPQDVPFTEAVGHFRELFTDAVRIRVRADAKVAFSLSGGLDSSCIVAVAADALPQSFRTYSIKFPGQTFDEEPLARLVYERYPHKIDYQIHIPQNDDFWSVANTFIGQQEEPFHHPDTEQFQAYLRKARAESYKVILIGAGGDELLSGYYEYFFPLLIALRENNRIFPMAENLFFKPDIWPKYCIRKRLKILHALLRSDINFLRPYMPYTFFNRSGMEKGDKYFKDKQITDRIACRKNAFPSRYHDLTVGYLSDWLMNYWLRNGDRSHFGVPIESRRPFLDYRLIDYTLTLPPEYMMRRGWTKYILRKSFENIVPEKVIWNRKKQGMPFNTVDWFSHAKPIIRNYLESVNDNPFINVNGLMQDYDQLKINDPSLLWRGVNFCLWWKRVIKQETL